jgi:hypothetical protein
LISREIVLIVEPMSLISEALKKAQKTREPGGYEGSAGRGRRGAPLSSGVLALIGAGVVALIVIAVVLTVIVVKRSPPTFAAAKPVPTRQPIEETPAPKPVVLTAPPATSAPVPMPVVKAPVVEPAPRSAAPTAPVANPSAKQDPRIMDFVDAIRVAGVRSSGAESKVLMNDRVYRVNDLVDRNLGLRLTGVQSDTLTFVDENGAVYTKGF